LVRKLVNKVIRLAGGLAQDEEHHSPVKNVTPWMPALLRAAAAEGAVLLENRVLPFPDGTVVNVFGRCQTDWFFTGYGSGGDVNAPYKIHLMDGLRQCPHLQVNEELAQIYRQFCQKQPADHGVWGAWPRSHPEMPLTEAQVIRARQVSAQAVVVIGRASGEDRENTLVPGSYYLTKEEHRMLELVNAHFSDTVVLLNIGSVMDLSWVKKYAPGGALLVWQGGMESGNAVADLLCGKVCPSGRLTDTVARHYEDYPSAANFGKALRNEYREDIYVGYRWFETFGKEKVLYPFGHGLSYTTFQKEIQVTDNLNYQVTVSNTGNFPGKETVLLYLRKPHGAFGNPARELVAFAKTKRLQPGERQVLTLTIPEARLASYDEAGHSGHRSCYLLPRGTYKVYLGGDVRQAECIHSFLQERNRVLTPCIQAAAPQKTFAITSAIDANATAYPRQYDLKQRIFAALPAEVPYTGDKGYKLPDVKAGRVSLDDFVAQLSPEELEAISRGDYVMDSALGVKGNAGTFGGVLQSLRDKGVPAVTTTDGPSGIRLYAACSLLPIGTLLACTFDCQLLQELFTGLGREMKERGTDVLLAPGMNIHRDPLCGRNFEYFSEDPVVSGLIAAAIVKGVQATGVSACPKHFACNNQEYFRQFNDSVVSERALREIYLKGFEICVKEAKPKNIMTSYNKVNGVWAHYHYDLVQTILRGEWGYAGNVITDWWMQPCRSPEFPGLRDNAYRVRAGVNVLMPGGRRLAPGRKPDGTLLASYGKKDGITLGEMQENARHVLRCVMDLKM